MKHYKIGKVFFSIKSICIICYVLVYFFSSIYITSIYSYKGYKGDVNYSLVSPYTAILAHLGYLDPCNHHPEVAAEVFKQDGVSSAQAAKYAIELKKIFDTKLFQLNIDEIPKDEDYIDPLVKYHKYQISKKLPQVYLVKVKDKWLYSYETIYYLQQLHVLDHEKILKWFPNWCKNYSFLGLYLWQYILVIVCIFIFWGVYKFIIFTTFSVLSKKWWSWEGLTKKIGRLFSTMVTCLVAKVLLPIMQLPGLLEKNITQGLEGLLRFLIMMQCYYLVNVLMIYIKQRAIDQNHAFTLHLLPLYHRLLKIIVVIVGSIATIDSLGYKTSSLLTGVSIGSLGFAFASQDTIKNLFGSLMIIIDEPFRVGDYVIVGPMAGRVEEIGFRSTRLRTQQGSILCIPNAKLADSQIDNYSLRQKRCFLMEITISYHTAPDVIFSFIEGLRSIAKNHALINPENQYIYLNTIKDASWSIFFSVNLDVNDRTIELACRHEIISLMMKLAMTLEIQLGNVHGIKNIDIQK